MRAKCINRELTTEVIVGAFMMTVLLGLGYFTIILSRQAWFIEQQPLDVRFAHVMGLRDGDNVVCRGMPIGTVDRLELRQDGVHVLANLESPVTLHEDYVITVVTTSILGGRHLEINEGTHSLPIVEREFYDGTPPYDLIGDAAAVVNGLRKGLVEEGTIENFRKTSEQLRDITTRINEGEGLLGRLVSKDDTLYNDIAASAKALREITGRLQEGKSTIGKLLSDDDKIYKDLTATVASLRAVAERLESGKSTLGKLMSDDAEIYKDLAEATASAKRIAENLEKGEGLIGRMLTDDSLYDDVSSTVKEARDTMEDMREASPVSTFSSIFFGAF
ncbi:MAG: MCE family protein [Kiritimatiellae bacterium]|nr:MCE family protein [Kiritimatiellia bacterium]